MMMAYLSFLCISVLGNIILYYTLLSLVGKKESPLFLILLSLMTSLFFYGVRLLPLYFGVHFFLQMIFLIIILAVFCDLPWSISFILALLAGIILGLTEGVSVPLLASIFSYNLKEVVSSPILRIVFAIPSLVLLTILAYIANKRGWRLLFIDRMMVSGKDQKGYLTSRNHPIILCLIQALILILLYINFYNYYTGVFPGLTFETLGIISSTVLITSSLITTLFAGYLLKITEREVKLERELFHVKEMNRLNFKMQVERHDFNNHLTSIYGFIKTEQYQQTKNYIENIYENVSQTKAFLRLEPPELGALLSIKQGEAEDHGIDFFWRVKIEDGIQPLSPEDLTQIVGNLLDNALESTVHPGKVDFLLKSNKIGLQIKVSNTCAPISQDIKNKVFAAGYTTKNSNHLSGLGLYIIKQIVDRNGGQLELREPNKYPGVEFVIHIPWKC